VWPQDALAYRCSPAMHSLSAYMHPHAHCGTVHCTGTPYTHVQSCISSPPPLCAWPDPPACAHCTLCGLGLRAQLLGPALLPTPPAPGEAIARTARASDSESEILEESRSLMGRREDDGEGDCLASIQVSPEDVCCHLPSLARSRGRGGDSTSFVVTSVPCKFFSTPAPSASLGSIKSSN
jgi:hypothetical protein